jgi:hypothetical protein
MHVHLFAVAQLLPPPPSGSEKDWAAPPANPLPMATYLRPQEPFERQYAAGRSLACAARTVAEWQLWRQRARRLPTF